MFPSAWARRPRDSRQDAGATGQTPATAAGRMPGLPTALIGPRGRPGWQRGWIARVRYLFHDQRAAEVVALHLVAVMRPQECQLTVSLDAFCDDLQVERFRQADDRCGDHRGIETLPPAGRFAFRGRGRVKERRQPRRLPSGLPAGRRRYSLPAGRQRYSCRRDAGATFPPTTLPGTLPARASGGRS